MLAYMSEESEKLSLATKDENSACQPRPSARPLERGFSNRNRDGDSNDKNLRNHIDTRWQPTMRV